MYRTIHVSAASIVNAHGRRLLAVLAAFAAIPFAGGATRVTLQDYSGRGFPPDLVQYEVPGTIDASGAVGLFDGEGKALPVQISDDAGDERKTLSFVTALPGDGKLEFTIRENAGSPPSGSLSVSVAKSHIEFGNAHFAVRLPAETAENFTTAKAASELPAPVLAFKDAGGPWLGRGRIASQEAVKSFRVEVTAKGPVFAELLYRIEWQNDGYYQARIQVIDGVPMARVHEEFDGIAGDTGFVELDLTTGWAPDRVEIANHNGNGGGDPNGRLVSVKDFFAGRKLHALVGDQAWSPRISHLGLVREDQMGQPDHPLVGIVPLRKGLWRRASTLEVVPGSEDDSVIVKLPMGVRELNWIKDGSSETSPFSTHEHDPSLPATFGRRAWGLALGHPAIPNPTANRPVYQLHRLYGIIGLDRYKDFVLEWEDGGVSYPRMTRAASGEVGPADIQNCLKQLRDLCRYYFTSFAASHHGTSSNYNIAFLADRVLASPNLPDAVRKEIRARVALIAHIYSDGDMMSYGNGYHHGNPNMGTARFWSGPTFAALVPDHPMSDDWTQHLLQYGRYNLATQIAPGGAYIEYGAAYHMHGFARTSNGLRGLMALAGLEGVNRHYTDYANPCWNYYMNTLTPFESRWQSRVIPGMANSQPGNTEHLLEAAASVSPTDSELARELAWAWQENGQRKVNPLLVDPSVQPKRAELTSGYYPGLGIIFRAHQGPDETFMLLRSGFNWSHWYIDPGHFIMMSRGATLVPFQSFQYDNSSDPGFDPNNTIRFGHPENQFPYGWPDSNIMDYHLGSSVDYAWASTGFPDWYITPGQSKEWSQLLGVQNGARALDSAFQQKQGAFDWDRQVIFMKGARADSPNYFVIRDSVTGEGQLSSYLNLRLLGTRERIAPTAGGFHVDTQWETDLDIQFTKPVTAEFHEQLFKVATHNSNIGDRVPDASDVSPDWVKPDGTPWETKPTARMKERNTILRIPAPPGQGYTWVLYPRRNDEAAPVLTDLGQGVVKIEHPEGTDYVLLSTPPATASVEGVELSGRAAAVRVGKDKTTLILASGPGHAGYRGHVLKSDVPFEREIPLADAKPGTAVLSEPPDDDGQVIATENGVRFVSTGHNYVKLTHGTYGVRGLGPFDLTITNDRISGTVSGMKRTLVVTWPEGIKRPMFTMDGRRYFAGWADDPTPNRLPDRLQFSIAFGVTEGEHQVQITEWTYPSMPTVPRRRQIEGF